MKFVPAILAAAFLAQAAQAQNPPPPPPPPPPPVVTRVVEFANVETGRDVWLADPQEIAFVESGGAGRGWARNGYFFETSSQHDEHRVDVCRFYAPSSNSHFFTANPQECAALRAPGSGWLYEKVAFRAFPAPAGGCGVFSVYRLYNGRWRQGDSAHRFTADRALRGRLLEDGWVDEGVAFCVEATARETQAAWVARSRGEGPRTDCEDPSANLGTCVMIRGLPAMPYASPSAGEFALLTRFFASGTLFTPRPMGTPEEARARSFVQVSTPGGDAPGDYFMGRSFGFHLVGSADAPHGLATLGLVHQFAVADPDPASRPDARVFPWGDGRERDLRLSFSMAAYVAGGLGDELSQAYGLGVLRFQDRASGRALMVTLQAWGRTPPANAVLRDIFTGQPIVSTFFDNRFQGERAAFGFTDEGGYSRCGVQSCFLVGPHVSHLPYAFRIARADFVKVIGMARRLDPALSSDPADYMVSSFQFRGESDRDATASFTVEGLTLTLSK